MSARRCWSLLLAALLLPATVSCANRLAAPNANDAIVNRVINDSIEAHGGSTLRNLKSIVIEWRTDDAQIHESRNPGPPWDAVTRWEGFALDFEKLRYAEARIDRAGGYEWITGVQSAQLPGRRLDYRARTIRETDQTFHQLIPDSASWSPAVLLRWLSGNPHMASYLGTQSKDGQQVIVLEVDFEPEKMKVFIDSESGLITGAQRSYVDYDGTPVPLDYRYSYANGGTGPKHPGQVELEVHGYVARRATPLFIAADKDVTEFFVAPQDFTRVEPEPQGLRNFRVEEIAPGVYFVGEGVMYQLIVEFDEFLVALDTCSGDVMKRVKAIQSLHPDKPFRYALASHHHNDHLHGLDEYTSLGAEILIAPQHKSTALAYLSKQGVAGSRLVEVADTETIRSERRELQIFDIGPMPHTEHLLAAYLPAEKILFEADLFVLGGRRTPIGPASQNARQLLAAIDGRGLDVKLIVDPHSPIIATIDDLRAAVALHDQQSDATGAGYLSELAVWHTPASVLSQAPETARQTKRDY